LHEVLQRYEARQITSGEVIDRFVELAKKMRDAHRRHEALGLTAEETAFYDAIAGGSDDWSADPKLADRAGARRGDQGRPDRGLGRDGSAGSETTCYSASPCRKSSPRS
jgi:hypothetical protein